MKMIAIVLTLCLGSGTFVSVSTVDKAKTPKKPPSTTQERAEKEEASSVPSTARNWKVEDLDVTEVGIGDRKTISQDGSYPRWSPDGKQILFTGEKGGLWVMDPDGKNRRQLVANGRYGEWSPNGSKIVYLVTDRKDGPTLYTSYGNMRQLIAGHEMRDYGAVAVYVVRTHKEFVISDAHPTNPFHDFFRCYDCFLWVDSPQWSKDGNHIIVQLRRQVKVASNFTAGVEWNSDEVFVSIDLDTLKAGPVSHGKGEALPRVAFPKFSIKGRNGVWAESTTHAVLLLPGEFETVDVSPDRTRVLTGGRVQGKQNSIHVARLIKTKPWNAEYEITWGFEEGIVRGRELGVRAPKINELNGRTVGWTDPFKGVVKVKAVKPHKSLTELVRWQGVPVKRGDVVVGESNMGTDSFAYIQPPQEGAEAYRSDEMLLGELSVYKKKGEKIIFGGAKELGAIGRGQCHLCHSFFPEHPSERAPGLYDLPMRAKTLIASPDYCKRGGTATTVAEYLAESNVCPSCYVVPGFGVKGTDDHQSPMPAVHKPPIGLTIDDLVAVDTYILSEFGAGNAPPSAKEIAAAYEKFIGSVQHRSTRDCPGAER